MRNGVFDEVHESYSLYTYNRSEAVPWHINTQGEIQLYFVKETNTVVNLL